AAGGRSCTLVFRRAYWMWPRYLCGVLNVQWLMFSRLTASALRYHRLSRTEAWLHGTGAPLVRFVWSSVTRLLRAQTGISGPFFEEPVRRQLEREDGFRLYRFILPPGVQRLGFVGYNSSTACQLTSEVAAHWLSDCFLGRLRPPSVEHMDREIDQVRRWAAEVMPARSRGFFVGPYVVPHLDELMCDMGLPTVRSCNFIAENLLPVWPARYRLLAEERRRRRDAPAPPARG